MKLAVILGAVLLCAACSQTKESDGAMRSRVEKEERAKIAAREKIAVERGRAAVDRELAALRAKQEAKTAAFIRAKIAKLQRALAWAKTPIERARITRELEQLRRAADGTQRKRRYNFQRKGRATAPVSKGGGFVDSLFR